MSVTKIKIVRIGNSRGVRLPAAVLGRYHVGASVRVEERPEGILLMAHRVGPEKLSWADTARDMANQDESWAEWDATSADGLDRIPWEAPANAVREKSPHYPAKRKKAGPKP